MLPSGSQGIVNWNPVQTKTPVLPSRIRELKTYVACGNLQKSVYSTKMAGSSTPRYLFHLVDPDGKDLAPNIQSAVHRVAQRLTRLLSGISDEAVVSTLVEDSARRVAREEQKHGPVLELVPYLHRAVLNAIRSEQRRRAREVQMSVALPDGPAESTDSDRIQKAILVRELLERIHPQAAAIALLKSEGYKSREIADKLGLTVRNVDTIYCRTRQDLRELLKTSNCEG
jgi:DNA-directed RNA polymerase specialized sigma24 family protein